jgi:CRISPR system Cascade subunit CasC
MFLEVHILQNFAPSNLNRDDTNAPKDCVFGGYRRARISSQCIKRSIRQHAAFKDAVLASGGDLGVRTKRLARQIADRLAERGRSRDEAERVAENVIKGARLKLDKDKKTEYLLYLGTNEIAALVGVAEQFWDDLSAVAAPEAASEEGKGARKKTGAKVKKEEQALLPAEATKAIGSVLGKSLAADVALFGRMVADDKSLNADAACQVAHALSTNEVSMEMDYYTAIDDLLPGEESGSDMIGTVQFNSSCFYRYAQINLGKLRENLAGDADVVRGAVVGFLRAAVEAVPTGKQNSMAAQNPPSYVRVFLRSSGAPWSLANAFVQPVRPHRGDDGDLVARSVRAAEEYVDGLKAMYGGDGFVCDLTSSMVPTAGDGASRQVVPFPTLVEEVANRIGGAETTHG